VLINQIIDWADELCKQFGLNPYNSLQYRYIHSSFRYHLIGGFFSTTSEFAYKYILKYPGLKDKYIIEEWKPNSFYGIPSINQEGYYDLGPPKTEGDYELACVLSSPATPAELEYTLRLLELSRYKRKATIKSAHEEELYLKQQEEDNNFNNLWDRCHTIRNTMTFGKHLSYNPAEDIERYKRKHIEAMKRGKLKPLSNSTGFSQTEE